MTVMSTLKQTYRKIAGCSPGRTFGALLVGSLIGGVLASKYDLSMGEIGYPIRQGLEDMIRAPAKIFNVNTKIPIF